MLITIYFLVTYCCHLYFVNKSYFCCYYIHQAPQSRGTLISCKLLIPNSIKNTIKQLTESPIGIHSGYKLLVAN